MTRVRRKLYKKVAKKVTIDNIDIQNQFQSKDRFNQ
jgi:hypothetical protein